MQTAVKHLKIKHHREELKMKKTYTIKKNAAMVMATMMILNGSLAVGMNASAEELETANQQTAGIEHEAVQNSIPETPEKPQADSYKDNDKINEYNKQVDTYNAAAIVYNAEVDSEYEQAVEETNRKNEEISRHNEAEEQKVKDAIARNEQAKAEAEAKNRQIDEENAAEEARINLHNEGENQKVKASEEAKAAAEAENDKISRHNDAEQKKADEYNAQVDSDYEKAVAAERERIEQIKAENEKIRQHNADEDQKVSDTAALNKEEEARIAQINQEREERYLKDVEQYNADKEQYDKDYAQYQTDTIMEQRIKAAGYASVEQYNALINQYYNEPAKKANEKNASAKEISVSDTYTVKEAAEKSGNKITVRIEHHFAGTDLEYVEEFEIDANDVITVSPVSSAAETTSPGYAQFYYKTDDQHQTGYWWETDSYVATNANYNKSGWNCGDTHEISFKDGKRHAYDEEDITVVYNYAWNPLRTAKTYNVPNEPTEPTAPVLELLNFEPITYEAQYQKELDETENIITKGDYYTPDMKDLIEVPELYAADYQTFSPMSYVLPVLEEIAEADIWEMLTDPVKGVYLGMLDYMTLFEEPEIAEENAAPSAQTPADPTTVNTTANSTNTTAANMSVNQAAAVKTANADAVIDDAQAPLAAHAQTVEDVKIPKAAAETGSWALINLLSAIGAGLMSLILLIGCFGRKEDEQDENAETVNRKRGVRVASLIPAIGAAIAFILTENMTLKMQLTDRWTIMMLIILAIQVVVALMAKTSKDEEEKDVETIKVNA